MPILLEKHIKEVDALLHKGEMKKAQEYINALPMNIRVKINVSLKKRYAEPAK